MPWLFYSVTIPLATLINRVDVSVIRSMNSHGFIDIYFYSGSLIGWERCVDLCEYVGDNNIGGSQFDLDFNRLMPSDKCTAYRVCWFLQRSR